MKRIAIGFGVMAVAFIIAYAVTGNIGIALCVMAVTVVLLPCRYDPAIQMKKPYCHGAYPTRWPHIQAEHGCHGCLHQRTCLHTTQYGEPG